MGLLSFLKTDKKTARKQIDKNLFFDDSSKNNHSLNNSACSSKVIGCGVSQSSDELVISQYSPFPRYFRIDGIKYDIDNPNDLRKFPLIKNTFLINGEQYGIDGLLNDHCYYCASNKDVYWAAYNKVQEYRKNGIVNISKTEANQKKQYEMAQQERFLKEEARKAQCNGFTIEDMQQFPDIPIVWSCIPQLQHTNGISWCQLNLNNQAVVLNYISQVNNIIVDAHEYIDNIDDSYIDLDAIDFDYPIPTCIGSMCNTRIECYPYTAKGKLSKYPIVIHFSTRLKSIDHGTHFTESCCSGEIKILRDGNIGSAFVSIHGTTFKIGLHGLSLVLQRVDNPYMGGNLFKFSEMYE